MFDRNKVGMMVAEFLGTAMLALVIIGAARYFNFTAPWYVGLAAGLALAVLVLTLGRVSGAHLNPAITVGLWTLKKIPTAQAGVYIAVQLLGGAMALALVEYTTGSDVLANGMSTFDLRVFVAEMAGALVFGFGVAAAVFQKLEGLEKAFTIGFSLTLGILVAAMAAPGFINPAIALAQNSWDRTVILAPVVGVILGMNLYSLFLAPEKSLRSKK